MTKISFDIISDLHADTRDFDWSGQPTSPNCIVLGDIASDLPSVVGTLEHLADVYQHVFYIDGRSEHTDCLDNLGHSYRALQHAVEQLKNVTYLQDNVVIINGVAILGTNGWSSFDFDSNIQTLDAISRFAREHHTHDDIAATVYQLGMSDSSYLTNSIKRLQRHTDVKTIVVCTHSVPLPCLVSHDTELAESSALATIGNSTMIESLKYDTEGKVKYWLFGHYHGTIDREIGGVRFMCNGLGRANTRFCQRPFYPRRVELDI